MNKRRKYITELAEFLCKNKKEMSGKELAEHLNRNKLRTNRGTKYVINGRGIFKELSAAYDKVKKTKGKEKAGHIANAFVNKKGNHEWIKKYIK